MYVLFYFIINANLVIIYFSEIHELCQQLGGYALITSIHDPECDKACAGRETVIRGKL